MKHTITIRKTTTGYTAQFSDPAIAELFGSDTISTPYLPTMDPSTVLSVVSRLNPQCDVILAKG